LRALEQPRKRRTNVGFFALAESAAGFWVAVQLLRSFRPAAVGQREVGATWGVAKLGTMWEKEFRYV
jgi:hypothetical protein